MMTITKLTIVSLAAVAIVLFGGMIGAAAWMLADGQSDTNTSQTPTTAPTTVPTPEANAENANSSQPQAAPFSGIRWHRDVPEVQVNGTWYELVAIDDLPVNQIFNFQRSHGDNAWHKHFAEDLVDVLRRMHHPAGDTVDLQVRGLGANQAVTTLQNVPMTEDNRRSLMVWPAPDQTSPFQAIRWQDAIPQVQINGSWYELVSVEHESAQRLVDSAKHAYGDGWQDQFQNNLMDVLKHRGIEPLHPAEVQLRTLDTNELVTITVRVPQPS
jgi:hypothetical protein